MGGFCEPVFAVACLEMRHSFLTCETYSTVICYTVFENWISLPGLATTVSRLFVFFWYELALNQVPVLKARKGHQLDPEKAGKLEPQCLFTVYSRRSSKSLFLWHTVCVGCRISNSRCTWWTHSLWSRPQTAWGCLIHFVMCVWGSTNQRRDPYTVMYLLYCICFNIVWCVPASWLPRSQLPGTAGRSWGRPEGVVSYWVLTKWAKSNTVNWWVLCGFFKVTSLTIYSNLIHPVAKL